MNFIDSIKTTKIIKIPRILKKSDKKFSFIFLYLFLLLEIILNFKKPLLAKSKTEIISSQNLNYLDEQKSSFNSRKEIFLNEQNTINIIQKRLFFLADYFEYFLANVFEENRNKLDIQSDMQYEEKGSFVAEGNVIIESDKGNINADRLIYDKINRTITIKGNITFKRGLQYFESSKIFYQLDKNSGYIKNVYGVINLKSFNNDFGLNLNSYENYSSEISEVENLNSTSLSIINEFESDKSLNIKDLNLNVPLINKWRFISEEILISPDLLESDQILFTNDIYNKPQLILESNGFRLESNKNKLKFISKNTWLNLDNKINIPLGRRSLFDRDPLSRWGIGYDVKEKDGLFITRSFDSKKIFGNYSFQITPYFLIQRAINGKTKTFKGNNNSIFGSNISQKNKFSDIFALDTILKGRKNNWDLNFKATNNSLDLEKLHESTRLKLNIQKSIELGKTDNDSETSDIDKNSTLKLNSSFLDFKLASSFREKISKGFSGEEEIYIGNTFSLINRNYKETKDEKLDYSFLYSLGKFNAKRNKKDKLANLLRNSLEANFTKENVLWRKKGLDKTIDENYKYSPKVIDQGLIWRNNLKSGLFIYEGNDTQKALSLNTGPQLILGSMTNQFFDYTKLVSTATYVFKSGESPFAFDNIDDTFRIKFELDQQLYGPLVLNLSSYLNLDSNDDDYSSFVESKFGLNFQRRAYRVGFFYKPDAKSLGINFDIFNFNYSGVGKSF